MLHWPSLFCTPGTLSLPPCPLVALHALVKAAPPRCVARPLSRGAGPGGPRVDAQTRRGLFFFARSLPTVSRPRMVLETCKQNNHQAGGVFSISFTCTSACTHTPTPHHVCCRSTIQAHTITILSINHGRTVRFVEVAKCGLACDIRVARKASASDIICGVRRTWFFSLWLQEKAERRVTEEVVTRHGVEDYETRWVGGGGCGRCGDGNDGSGGIRQEEADVHQKDTSA